MKTWLLLVSILVINSNYAQTPIGISNDIKNFALADGRTHSQTITTFSNPTVRGTQYLFDQWTAGSVTTTDNITFNNSYLFNFDKLNQNLYAKFTNQQDMSVLLDKGKVKTFTIGTQDYINASIVDPKAHEVFYQVLVNDSLKVSLFKFKKTRFEKADPTNLMNIKTGNLGSQYVEDITYFAIIKGELKKINLSENSMRKTFKDKNDKVESFFSLNPNREVDETVLVDLVKYLNS